MKTTIYDELHAAVRPLLQHYETDLETHDKRDLGEHPGTPFLHWTHYSGTTLVFLLPADDTHWPKYGEVVPYLFATADREHILEQVKGMAAYHVRPSNNPSGYTCHHFDGKTLRKITVEKAVEVARVYYRSVDSQWQAERLRIERPSEYRALGRPLAV